MVSGGVGSLTVVCGVGYSRESTVVSGCGHSRRFLEAVSAGEKRAGVIADFKV